MLLPSKHIRVENALIGVGAEVLRQLESPKLVSELYHEIQQGRAADELAILRFDNFLLTLDFLFTIGAITLEGDELRKRKKC